MHSWKWYLKKDGKKQKQLNLLNANEMEEVQQKARYEQEIGFYRNTHLTNTVLVK